MTKTEKIVQSLAQGQTRRTVAENFGVSRQHVDRLARERAAEIAAKDSEPVSYLLDGTVAGEDDVDIFVLNPTKPIAPQLLDKARKALVRLDKFSGVARLYFLACEIIERIDENDKLAADNSFKLGYNPATWESMAGDLAWYDGGDHWGNFEGKNGRGDFLQFMAKLKSVANDKNNKAGVKSKTGRKRAGRPDGAPKPARRATGAAVSRDAVAVAAP